MVQMAKGLDPQTVAAAVAKCKDAVMEPKLDGWRGIVVVEEERARLYKPSRHKSKAAIEYTEQVPELLTELAKLPAGTILDGEIVMQSFDAETGLWSSDFHGIQTAMASGVDGPKAMAQKLARQKLQFVAFDVLVMGDGADALDLSGQPFSRRRTILEQLHGAYALNTNLVQVIAQFDATQEIHDDLVGMGMEGTVIKCRTATYAFAKRGYGWFKIKSTRTMDTVVMQVVMDGKGQHAGLAGRMTVGQYKDGELVQVATVNCLNNAQRLEATNFPERFEGTVLEVKIYGWDKDGPRHPTPLRFRADRDAESCIYDKEAV